MKLPIFFISLLFSAIENCLGISILNLGSGISNVSILNPLNAIKDKVEYGVNDTVNFFSNNGVKLNCFGIPITMFSSAIENMFTQTTKAQDVRFYLFSRDQEEDVTVHVGDPFKLDEINFKTERKTVVLVHGFLSSGREEWLAEMKDAILRMEDANVIIVDWQKGSNTWNYYSASISTRIVASQIANFLNEIRREAGEGSTYGNLHFVGHSLGSHICAHAGYLLNSNENKEDWVVERITGLDPAQPCFSHADVSLKLDKTDALFVDVIHTNARNIMFLGLGLPAQLGHIDFYPNGGQIQVGCKNINTKFWNFLAIPSNLIKATICSHGRSHELFTDSINVALSQKCTYRGHRWDQKYENISALLKDDCDEDVCPEMGINSVNYHPDKDGIFFIPTGDSAPFCNVTENHKVFIERQLKSDGSMFSGLMDQMFG